MQIGNKIFFGNYPWIVLDVKMDRALIITEYIIEQRSYHDAYVDTTWADCALRKYLNVLTLLAIFSYFALILFNTKSSKSVDNSYYWV